MSPTKDFSLIADSTNKGESFDAFLTAAKEIAHRCQ